jgi:hypothetical protein
MDPVIVVISSAMTFPTGNKHERSVMDRGRTVLAMDGVLAGAEVLSHPAAQLDR